MAVEQPLRREWSDDRDFRSKRTEHPMVKSDDLCTVNMIPIIDPRRIKRRRACRGKAQRQHFVLDFPENSMLRMPSCGLFLCLLASFSLVHGWSSTIRATTMSKVAPESISPSKARRSSLVISLLEPPTTFPSGVPLSSTSSTTPLQMALELQTRRSIPGSPDSRFSWHISANSFRQSTSSRASPFNKAQSPKSLQNHMNPSMFLTGRFFPTASLSAFPHSSGVDSNRGPRAGDNGRLDGLMLLDLQSMQLQRQQRGILGFDVFELDATRSAGGDRDDDTSSGYHNNNRQGSSGGSRLKSSRSKVDMNTWNSGRETLWEDDQEEGHTDASRATDRSFFPAPLLTWRNAPLSVAAASSPSDSSSRTFNLVFSKQGMASPPASPVRLLQHSLPAWFPWIPSKSQIESLKVNELKEACIQRGVAKVRLLSFAHISSSKRYSSSNRSSLRVALIVLLYWFEKLLTTHSQHDRLEIKLNCKSGYGSGQQNTTNNIKRG